ncbi:small redox-active disulfide protein 2 [Azonexus fungiphilus]|jgi:small redox-active disulfide protein 2|uniref:Small redox-active disulfide protein 2 n=1 Tax=Azonexus fungiphilus TaxID=146940 RepID=A0A495WKV4_9RHOO|nr:thioredoxin family protein [Azonexus fungiphilus]NHC06340.1 thioredoxin family protein [Azonexus fungiphilus]RKT62372.1 small redox-active disulfide protein 2 [Azonexus fungiphilus]
MKDIKVLGTGCANCRTTVKLIEEVASERNVAVNITKIEDLPEIMKYGVMSTPGVVVDGKVVHAGGVPDRTRIESWL